MGALTGTSIPDDFGLIVKSVRGQWNDLPDFSFAISENPTICTGDLAVRDDLTVGKAIELPGFSPSL